MVKKSTQQKANKIKFRFFFVIKQLKAGMMGEAFNEFNDE